MERAEEDQPDLPWSSYVFAVWNLIIRPPRQKYSQNDLVRTFPHGGFVLPHHRDTRVKRTDFTVHNLRGFKLACTMFEPILDELYRERACVVYCHGNSSSRMSGFELVPVFCPLNIAVVCFDFSGSGWSGGDYVSLGFHEREDLRAVIEHLRDDRGGGFTRIGVWGYSMGAVAALMFTASDMSIAGVLADSPFNDLTDLIKDVCRRKLCLPNVLIDTILPVIRLAIQKKASFDINEVSASKYVDKCFVPGLFLHGDMDDFIPPDHSSLLESHYSGESMRIVMPKLTHNCKRPRAFLERAAVFFVRAMRWESFLPKGVTEEQLSRKAHRHLKPSNGPKRGIGDFDAEIDRASQDAVRLVTSSRFVERSRGFVKVACELCCAYQGAEVVPVSGNSIARCPVRFSCNMVLPGDCAEIALCWSQEEDTTTPSLGSSGSAHSHRAVYFAVVSPSTISITRVVLAPARGIEVGLNSLCSSGTRRPRRFAGFVCTSVEPLALAAAELAPFTPHQVVLRILGGCIEFSAAGTSVIVEQRGSQEDLCVWCVQWKPAALDAHNAPLIIHLKCTQEEEEEEEEGEDAKVETPLQTRSKDAKKKKAAHRKRSARNADPWERLAEQLTSPRSKRLADQLASPRSTRLAKQLVSHCFDRRKMDDSSSVCCLDVVARSGDIKESEDLQLSDLDRANYRTHMLLLPEDVRIAWI